MITADFLPGVCENYQMYPEISQDLMWYQELLSFNGFLMKLHPWFGC